LDPKIHQCTPLSATTQWRATQSLKTRPKETFRSSNGKETIPWSKYAVLFRSRRFADGWGFLPIAGKLKSELFKFKSTKWDSPAPDIWLSAVYRTFGRHRAHPCV
jgi:hypothetical protein